MKVVVSQRIVPEGLELLRASGHELDVNEANVPLAKDALIDRLKDADALVCLLTDRIDQDVLECTHLKVVANVAVGYNNIDVESATALGVVVTNTPDVLTEATADLTFALLLAAARRVPESERYLRAGNFKGWELFQPHLGLDVHGTTLGLIGMGRIAQAVARRAQGFRMRVLYWNRSRLDASLERELGATYVNLNDLLNESDFVSVHTPLTHETKHLISTPQFKAMKRSAILVNTSRGPVVDEAALAAALSEGDIAGAALDVFEEEPIVHSKLLEHEKHVVLVPHIGSATHTARRAMSILAVENALAVLAGNGPLNPVNDVRTPRAG